MILDLDTRAQGPAGDPADRLALLFTLVMPLAFTAFFGLMFGGGSDRLPLAVWSGDAGPAAEQLRRRRCRTPTSSWCTA